MTEKELHSEKISKGSRTFFFDIKESKNGGLYLKVSESKRTSSGFEHHRLMIFDDDLKEVSDMFNRSVAILNHLKKQRKQRVKSPEKIR